jgi:hypothetical protein
MGLLAAVESKTILVGLIATQVQLELVEHVDHVQEEAKDAMARLGDRVKRIDAIASALGAVGSTDLSHLDDHVVRARAAVDRWVLAALNVPQSNDTAGRALSRLNQAQAPAHKGKDSMKDCVVIETYLEAIRDLREDGLTAPVVFVSSNTKDYAEAPGSRLRAELATEFAPLNIEYASTWDLAKHILGV